MGTVERSATPESIATGEVLSELIVELAGSVQAYTDRFNVDRRNLYRYFRGRDMQLTTLLVHLRNLDFPADEFMRRVELRLADMAAAAQTDLP